METGIINIILDRNEFSDEIGALKKRLHLITDPPFTKECYEEIIIGYPNIPPQPCVEYIPIETIRNELCRDYRAFIYLDLIVSLLNTELYNKLDSDGWSEEHEVFEEKLRDTIKKYVCSRPSLYPEDAHKENILMLIPSNKQFNEVWNNWEHWVWRRRTLNGEHTPTEEGWARDIISIVENLNREGVRCLITIDKEIEQKIMERYADILTRPLNKSIVISIESSKAKVGYVRDQSITLMDKPIIGNMALPIRRDEERTIVDIYNTIGLAPLLRFRWVKVDNYLELSKMEGGNIIYIETDKGRWILTGIGVRGSNIAAMKILRESLPEDINIIGIPLSGYIKNWSETGAVHLDVVLTYLGDINGTYYAVIDPMRMGFYSALQLDNKGRVRLLSIPQLFKEMDVYIDEIRGDEASKITMANALNLGGGKLVVDIYNKEVNKYLVSEFGVDLIEVNIPHIEAGGGGVRCVTRELWGIH